MLKIFMTSELYMLETFTDAAIDSVMFICSCAEVRRANSSNQPRVYLIHVTRLGDSESSVGKAFSD